MNFRVHVASDIGIDQQFISPSNLKSQLYLDNIATWTQDNLMKLNIEKSNYIMFSRSKFNFTTGLQINDQNINRLDATKILDVL